MYHPLSFPPEPNKKERDESKSSALKIPEEGEQKGHLPLYVTFVHSGKKRNDKGLKWLYIPSSAAFFMVIGRERESLMISYES